ncbi:MAG TPA: hypothetical protein VL361_02095 [Candidatus Limnocylindrales bacterium]|jgi:hypothetical protein|nr:hypothetical protein [Candidatus Limnocylindrales bacterium]
MQSAVGVNSLPLQVVDGQLTSSQRLQPDIKISFINGHAEQSEIGVIVINQQNM